MMVYELNKYIFSKDNELVKQAFELIMSRNIYNGHFPEVLQDSINKASDIIFDLEEPLITLTQHLGTLIVAIKTFDDPKNEEALDYLENKATDLADIACKLNLLKAKFTSAFILKCINGGNSGECSDFEMELEKLSNEGDLYSGAFLWKIKNKLEDKSESIDDAKA